MLLSRNGTGVLTLSVLMACAAAGSFAGAADAVATPGLAPQFGKWPVPLYVSNVRKTSTWAANSYEIETSDSVEHVLGWYSGKLKDRAMPINGRRLRQLAVDGGSYVINVLKSGAGASINVIKNGRP
jgi:hypothetical protein